MEGVHVFPVSRIPEVKAGDDLPKLIAAGARASGVAFADKDVVVVKQKVVSKSEGRLVELDGVRPGPRARALAKRQNKDPRLVELILRESVKIVREGHGVIIARTRAGMVCANAGIDQSNVPRGFVALLPEDPDLSAARLRRGLEALTGKRLAVIVSDTFGRPWRRGQTDVAIGCSGILPLLPYAGKKDSFGYELRVTEPAVVDELAGAAELVTGKLNQVPVAVVRGAMYRRGKGGVSALVMDPKRDLFR